MFSLVSGYGSFLTHCCGACVLTRWVVLVLCTCYNGHVFLELEVMLYIGPHGISG